MTPTTEALAKIIYTRMPYDEPTGTKPAWVEGGNSLKQDEARSLALAIASAIEKGQVEGVIGGKELAEFQDDVRDMLMQRLDVLGIRKHIDGGGCDSGDWRDFTKDEIGQAFNALSDHYYDIKAADDGVIADLTLRLAAAEAERDQFQANYCAEQMVSESLPNWEAFNQVKNERDTALAKLAVAEAERDSLRTARKAGRGRRG